MPYLLLLLLFSCGQFFCDCMDCSLPGFSVHRIFQAGVLNWVAVSFSIPSPDLGIEPSCPALAGELSTTELPGKPKSLRGHPDMNQET